MALVFPPLHKKRCTLIINMPKPFSTSFPCFLYSLLPSFSTLRGELEGQREAARARSRGACEGRAFHASRSLRALSALHTTKNPILLFNACLINDFFPNTQLCYSVFFCVLFLKASYIKLVYTHAMIHQSPLTSLTHKCLLLGRKG